MTNLNTSSADTVNVVVTALNDEMSDGVLSDPDDAGLLQVPVSNSGLTRVNSLAGSSKYPVHMIQLSK